MQDELTPSWFIGVDWTGAETHRRAFAERFKLAAPVGRGGSAEVWKATDPTNDTDVAIKVLVHEVARSARFQALLRNEVRAVARLAHPNIVRLLDVGTLGPEVQESTEGRLVAGSPFLAMELLQGGTLVPLIAHPRPWPVIRSILVTLLEVLAHAHARGVVHLDLKPSNVMRRSADDTDIALTDFGIAWIARDPVPVGSGTPAYAAPEQLIGDGRDIGPGTDLFALGCLAWELTTGAAPFDALDPHARAFAKPAEFCPRMDVPPTLESWLRRLLEPAPRRRPHSAHAARTELVDDVAGIPPDWRTGTVSPTRSFGYGLGLCELSAVPFVGRARARDRLWREAREAILSGKGTHIEIAGPPGSGRLRLAEWLAIRLRELDAATVMTLKRGHGGSLAEALQQHFRTRELNADRITSRLEDEIGAHWLVRSASKVLAGASTDPEPLHALVTRMTRRKPVVIISAREPPSIESAITIRITERTQHGIALRPFDDAERAELLHDVLRLGDEPRQILEALTPWPGNLLAALGHWMESGKLERRGAMVELRERPPSVADVWEERLHGLARRLNEAEVRAIEVAAVLGSGCEIELWQRAARLSKTFPTLAAIDRMAMEALCELQEGRITLADADIGRALIQRAEQGGRLQAHHRACAEALRERPATRAEERRAVHLFHAGEHEAASPLLIARANARLDALDPKRALELLEMAERSLETLGAAPSHELVIRSQLLRSRATRRSGDLDGAARLAKLAHRAARKHGSALLRAETAHQRGRIARAQGNPTHAMQYLLEAREAAREIGYVALLADALIDMANVLRGQGADVRALHLVQEAIAVDPRPKGRAMARVLAARLARGRLDLDGAGTHVHAAIHELEEHRPRLLPEAWGEAGDIARARGDYETATSWYRKALEGFVELGSVRAPLTQLKLGLALVEVDDIESADGHIRGALSAWHAAGRDDLAGGWQLALAWIHARSGQWTTCDALLAETARLDDEDWRALFERLRLAAADGGALLAHLPTVLASEPPQ